MTSPHKSAPDRHNASGSAPQKMSLAKQKDLILGILISFLEQLETGDTAPLRAYASHVGFDFGALGGPGDLLDAWLGHYRLARSGYDADRASLDLATFPPIAQRIVELMAEKSRETSR